MGYPNYPCTTCTTPSNFYSFRCIPESIDGQPPRFPALPPLHRTKSRWHCCGSSRSPGTCPAVAVIWNLNQESDRDMFWSPYKKRTPQIVRHLFVPKPWILTSQTMQEIGCRTWCAPGWSSHLAARRILLLHLRYLTSRWGTSDKGHPNWVSLDPPIEFPPSIQAWNGTLHINHAPSTHNIFDAGLKSPTPKHININ